MYHFWHWLLYLLTWAAHDPATLAHERARCAGAVAVAYAALAVEPVTKPMPNNIRAEVAAPCVQCSGTGRIYRSDGGWVRCPCGACPTGRCPTAR
jgi:hypothetical protein